MIASAAECRPDDINVRAVASVIWPPLRLIFPLLSLREFEPIELIRAIDSVGLVVDGTT